MPGSLFFEMWSCSVAKAGHELTILPQAGSWHASRPPAWGAFLVTVGRGRRGLLLHLQQPLGGLTPRPLSLPLSHPEKIFSETTPKCEKCQSVVKPGEPQGRGLGVWDWSWDPFPPLHWPSHTPDLDTLLPVPSLPVLQRLGICLPSTPGLNWAPTPDCSCSVSHVPSPLSLCPSVCFYLRYRVFR